ncbi:MAG: EamA family transporter [Oscillospiraceae bacterium]|nr:EamA family transporter [Oscillospiraceae bacterium]
MTTGTNDRKSLLMYVSSMLIFGSIGVFRRFIPLSSEFLAFARGLIGGLFLIAFVKLKNGKVRFHLSSRQLLWLIISGAIIGVNWIMLFEAYTFTTIATTTLCYYIAPIIVLIISPILFREKLTTRKIVCAVIAIIGMVLVSGVTNGSDVQDSNMRGVFLALGAAVLYAIVIIINKKLVGIDAYEKTILQLFSAGLVMVPYLLLSSGFGGGEWNTLTVVLLLVVGIVHTGISYALYFGSTDGLKAQTIAIFSYIDPVSAMFFSALFLHEITTITGVIGAIMILGSAIVSEL